jgi:hypothetical protein
MSLFKGIDPTKRYGLVDTADGRQLFTFHVHNEDPLEIFIDSGPLKDSRILIDVSTPFKSPKYSLKEVGVYLVQPTKSSVKTAAYRAQTAAERVEEQIRTRIESERLKAMAPANESAGVVHLGGPEKNINVGELSNAVFWGVADYPRSDRKKILVAIYVSFFKAHHALQNNNANSFKSNFASRKAKLEKTLRSRGVDPSRIDYNAAWTDYKYHDRITERYREASAEFSGSGAAASAPPSENELSSGNSLENFSPNMFEAEGGSHTKRRRRRRQRRHTRRHR